MLESNKNKTNNITINDDILYDDIYDSSFNYIYSKLHYDYENCKDEKEIKRYEDLFKELDNLKMDDESYSKRLDQIEEYLDVKNIKNLNLLHYFGDSLDNFTLFEMNKYKDYSEEELVALISNSPYISLENKLHDLEKISKNTNNDELKQDILDYIEYKKACIKFIYDVNDKDIIFFGTNNVFGVGRNYSYFEDNSCYSDVVKIRNLGTQVDPRKSSVGTIYMVPYRVEIGDVFVNPIYLNGKYKTGTLNKYYVIFNLDLDDSTLVRKKYHFPYNVITKTKVEDEIIKEEIEKSKSHGWMVFNVKVRMYTSHGNFENEEVLNSPSFDNIEFYYYEEQTNSERALVRDFKTR